MSKLFIIGNGFDIASNVESKYEHFRKYLISQLNKVSGRNYEKYDFCQSDIITIDYQESKENDILTILYFISKAEAINSIMKEENPKAEWSDIERSLGLIDYDDFSYLYVTEDDDHEYRAHCINEDIFSPYVRVLCEIPDYFAKWVKQIDLSKIKIKDDFMKLIKGDCKFLNFNYTDTLEIGYGVNKNNICYIHGNAVTGTTIHFGHGNAVSIDDYIEYLGNTDYYSVADYYETINRVLQKKVKAILENNYLFFEELDDVKEVFSFGFSYGDVDKEYVERIIENIGSDAEWKICYSVVNCGGRIEEFPPENERSKFEKDIKKLGFRGIVKCIPIYN